MAKLDKIFQKNKNLILLGIVVLCFSVIFIPFINIIGASVLTAYFAYPLFMKLRMKMNQFFAVSITWTVIISVILIPLAIIGFIGFSQTKSIINQVKSTQIISPQTIESLKNDSRVQYIFEHLEENEEELKKIQTYIEEKATDIGKSFLVKTGDIVKSIPINVIKFILYVFITTSLLMNGPKIIGTLREILPVDEKIFDTYITKIKHMTDGIMKGNFIVAGIQAVTTTLSFILAGIPYAGVVFIVSFILYIPMIGTVILYIPATIYLIIQGKYLTAVLIFLWNSVAVANIDNVLRGSFVSEEARINNTLMFISILSGIVLFGVMGVLYGPILAIIGLTSIKMYIDLKK